LILQTLQAPKKLKKFNLCGQTISIAVASHHHASRHTAIRTGSKRLTPPCHIAIAAGKG
jgi:hypothetical protein